MIFFYFCSGKEGALAQLARAFDWQSRGHRFDSVMLHFYFQRIDSKRVNPFLFS